MLADMLLLIPLPTEFPYKFVLWLVCVWLVHEEFLYRHRPTVRKVPPEFESNVNEIVLGEEKYCSH